MFNVYATLSPAQKVMLMVLRIFRTRIMKKKKEEK
jgi:hypothetical protein